MIIRYRDLFIEHDESPEVRQDVSSVEIFVGAPLPSDFRDFLLTANGGFLFYEYSFRNPSGESVSIPFHMVCKLGYEQAKTMPTTVVGLTEVNRPFDAPETLIQFGFHPLTPIFFDVPPIGTGGVYCDLDQDQLILASSSFELYLETLRVNYDSVLSRLEVMIDITERFGDSQKLARLIEWMNSAVSDWRDRYPGPSRWVNSNLS